MHRLVSSPFCAAIVLAATLAGSAGAAGGSGSLLARMSTLNPNLHAFTAAMHANVALKSFPFLTAQLAGTLYHKDPDKNKVVITSGLPLVAQQFDKLFANIAPPSQWERLYAVTVVGDDGKTTSFHLVPLKRGNVASIDAKADDKAATVEFMRWNYANGGFAEMHNTYDTIEGNVLVASQTGHIEEPGYTADVTSKLDDYKLNPPLADSVFEH